jgi:hypothetical protein
MIVPREVAIECAPRIGQFAPVRTLVTRPD